MSRRGRHYYDPITQTESFVQQSEELSRIELYPESDARDGAQGERLRWVGRLIGPDGMIVETAPGDFDHDRAMVQAQELWPNLTVYELQEESEDSTWTGFGPSPRMWRGGKHNVGRGAFPERGTSIPNDPLTPAVQAQLRVFPISEPGAYVLLDDVRGLLELWAVQYEVDKNPSGALALREAVDMLKDVG